MRRVLRALISAFIFLPSLALAQIPGGNGIQLNATPVTGSPAPVVGDCLTIVAGNKVGQAVCGGAPSGAAGGVLSGTYPNPGFASIATNTALANATAGSAAPTAIAVPSCSTASSALTWTTNTGFGCNTISAGLPLIGTGATVVTSAPLLDLSQTWNNAGVTFTAIKLNITNTASNAASLLLDLQRGSVSQFSVRNDGLTTATQFTGLTAGSASAPAYLTGAATTGMFGTSTSVQFATAGTVRMGVTSFGTFLPSGGAFGWSNAAGVTSADTGLSRISAAVVGLGNGSGGDKTGTLQLTTLTATGTITGVNATFSGATITMSALPSDAATTDNSVCVTTGTGVLSKGSGTLGICLGTSSARYKRDIIAEQDGLAEITSLRPVNYRYRAGHGDNGARDQYGFLAEDVIHVLPKLVGLDSKGQPNTVDMLGMFPVMVTAIQELNAKIARLESAR